jgi:hypothetical protein
MFHTTTIIPSAFWGLLEGQRTILNQGLSKAKKNKVINDWYNFAWIVFSFCSIGYFGFFFLFFAQSEVRTSLIFIFLGIANLFEIVSRGRYSAIFAQARVYRPQSSILGLEAFCFFLNVSIFFYFRNSAALLFGFFLSKILVLVFSWHFTSRAYKIHRLASPRLIWRRIISPRLPDGIMRINAWNHFFYMLLQRASSVFILLMLYQSSEGALPIVFHLVSTLVTASSNWIQIFYFDFRQFRLSSFKTGLERYVQPLLGVSVLIGISASLAAVITLKLMMSWQIQILYLPLMLFLITRGLANTRFFLMFDQLPFSISATYFSLTILAPSLLIYLGDYDDRSILGFMGTAQFIAFLVSFFVGKKSNRYSNGMGPVTYSAAYYQYIRSRELSASVEFVGCIDKSLTSPRRFGEKLANFPGRYKSYVDQSGIFFMLLGNPSPPNELLMFFMGDVLYFNKSAKDQWEKVFSKHRNTINNYGSRSRLFEVYSADRSCHVKKGKLIFKSDQGLGLESHSNVSMAPSCAFDLDPGELFYAATRSAASGRMIRLRCVSQSDLYVFTSVAEDGLIKSVKIAVSPDFRQ